MDQKQIKQIYQDRLNGLLLKEIAEKYDLTLAQVSARLEKAKKYKQRENGQKILTLNNGDVITIEQKEEVGIVKKKLIVIKRYKHFVLCLVNGHRECFGYNDLARMVKEIGGEKYGCR